MSYTISVTDYPKNSGTIVVETGATNVSTSLTLIGKNTPNYGTILNQNLMNLMQNFAGSNVPNGPVEGQLWFNNSTGRLAVYNNTIFKAIAQLSFSTASPTAPYGGELWWDGSESQLKIFNGAVWVVIGPNYIPSGASASADTVADNTFTSRDILKLVVGGSTIGVVSKDGFVPNSSYAGLTRLTPGINLTPNTSYSGGGANITTIAANTISTNTLLASNIGNITTAITANTVTATTFTGNIIGNSFGNSFGSASGDFTGTVGATTPNTGVFTTVTTVGGGQVTGYHTGPIGANTANTGVFTTLTSTSGYQGAVSGPVNGTIGETTPNIGAFTTITTSSYANVANVITTNGIYWANGLPFISSLYANSNYANSNVAAYLPTYNGTVGNLTTTSGGQITGYFTGIIGANTANSGIFTSVTTTGNIGIALVAANVSTDGEIQSGRMMARYNATKGVFFDVNNNGTVASNDAIIIARLEPFLNASSGGFEYLQPALGSNFGSKKVGVGFHVGTTSEILANAANISTSSISGNVNAVVLGYMNNGPRILLMDYALSDNQANVTTYNSTLHRFYGNIGVGVSNASVALDVAGSISATGNLTVGNVTATGTVVMGSSFKRNHIINGNMKVAQRGTSFTNVGSGSPLQYTLDRWFGYRSSYAGGLSISQQAGFAGAQYCLRHQRAASDTNIGGMLIGQIIESSNLIDLQGQNVTVSFWARTGANYSGGSLTVGLATGTTADEGSTAFVSGWTGGSYPINTTQAITSTATRYTFTGTVPSNALEMIFHIVWTPSGTAGAADYIEITNVQIEPGIVATPYEYQKINEQLAECQRYCFTIPAAGGASAVYQGTSINTTTTFVFVTYPVTPRKAFTSITVKGLNSYYNLINWTNSGTGSATGITLLDSSINVGTISITTTAGSPTISAGNSIGLRLQNTGATLVFEGAEL